MVSLRGRGDFVKLQCLSPIDQLVRAVGQNYRDFRDLFSCTFLTKDFPEKRYFVSNCPVLSITDSKLSRQSPVGNFSYRILPGNFRAHAPPQSLLKHGGWQGPRGGATVPRWWRPVWLDSARGPCVRERSRGHMGHIEGIFRDLFLCTFLTKDFPENMV